MVFYSEEEFKQYTRQEMAASMSTFDFVETKSKILEKLERNKILNKIKTFLDKLESEISKNDETDEANR